MFGSNPFEREREREAESERAPIIITLLTQRAHVIKSFIELAINFRSSQQPQSAKRKAGPTSSSPAPQAPQTTQVRSQPSHKVKSCSHCRLRAMAAEREDGTGEELPGSTSSMASACTFVRSKFEGNLTAAPPQARSLPPTTSV